MYKFTWTHEYARMGHIWRLHESGEFIPHYWIRKEHDGSLDENSHHFYSNMSAHDPIRYWVELPLAKYDMIQYFMSNRNKL